MEQWLSSLGILRPDGSEVLRLSHSYHVPGAARLQRLAVQLMVVAHADVSVLLQHSTLLLLVKSLLQFTLTCSKAWLMFAEDTHSQKRLQEPQDKFLSFPNKSIICPTSWKLWDLSDLFPTISSHGHTAGEGSKNRARFSISSVQHVITEWQSRRAEEIREDISRKG